MLADLRQTPEPTCADNCCAHHTVPISRGAAFYQSFGVTRFGSRRYRCTAYHKTFSVRKSTAGQKQLLRNTHNFGGVNRTRTRDRRRDTPGDQPSDLRSSRSNHSCGAILPS